MYIYMDIDFRPEAFRTVPVPNLLLSVDHE